MTEEEITASRNLYVCVCEWSKEENYEFPLKHETLRAYVCVGEISRSVIEFHPLVNSSSVAAAARLLLLCV
jgi:hypothetical protein